MLITSCEAPPDGEAGEAPAVMVAAIDLDDGHRVEYLRDVEGNLVYAEHGKRGTPSLRAVLSSKHPAEVWRELAPGAPVPAALLQDRATNCVLRPAGEPAVVRGKAVATSPYAADVEPICECSGVGFEGRAEPWIECRINVTESSSFRKDDTLSAESGLCNNSFYAVRYTVKHRTFFSWSTDINEDIDQFKWEVFGKIIGGGLIDFDFISTATKLSTPEPVFYNHIARGVKFP
jgi:hypothetical protein